MKHLPFVSLAGTIIFIAFANVLNLPSWLFIVLFCVIVLPAFSAITLGELNSVPTPKRQPVIELRQRAIGIQDADGNFITEVQAVTHRGIKGWAVDGDVDQGFYPDDSVSIWLLLE